jgi:hypothetical protein
MIIKLAEAKWRIVAKKILNKSPKHFTGNDIKLLEAVAQPRMVISQARNITPTQLARIESQKTLKQKLGDSLLDHYYTETTGR